MPKFTYTAKNKEGVAASGVVEAGGQKAAVKVLQDRGFFVTSMVLKKEGAGLDYWVKRLRGVSLTEKVIFTNQLATMITAGLPLAQALEILASQSENPAMKEVVNTALKDVQGGTALSKSLSKYPKVFSSVYINLLKAGEASGSLDKILNRMAQTMEESREFKSKIKGALIYPVIVIAAMAVVFIIMMVFVIPKLTAMYEDIGAELPLPTKIMMALSDFFVTKWWVLIIAGAGATLGFFYAKRTDYGKYRLAQISLRIPIFGPLNNARELTELTRTLSLLVTAGIPIVESLEIVSGSVGNVLFQEAVQRSAQAVEKGSTLAVPLKKEPIFPSIVPQLVSVGEETGKLDEVLSKLSKFFSSEAEHMVKNLTTALEPAIMIVLGVMVALLIVSIITPIYNLTQQF